MVHMAGTGAKCDCLVTYEEGEAPLSIVVRSTNGSLFRKAIEEAARHEALLFRRGPESGPAEPGVVGGRLEIIDQGALDYVVAARVGAALRASGLERAAPPASSPGPAALGGRRERPRRSRLYVPGNQPDFQVNAGLFGADCLVLDLEDSVEAGRKDEARALVTSLLTSARALLGRSEAAVRVNPLASPWGTADLEGLVPCRPEAFILPKCESASQVQAWDAEVSRLELLHGLPKGSVLFMPLVETARGLAHAMEIAEASRRNVVLCLGAEDLRSGMGLGRLPLEEELGVARSLLAIAAAASGLEASDSVFSAIDDDAGLAASARRARDLGFAGKGIVHPCQIEAVHAAFSPSEEDLAWAHAVVEALDSAAGKGRGAAAVGGMMVDAPLLARARRILAASLTLAAPGGAMGAAGNALSPGGDHVH